jgi:hypothetical protein
MPATKKENEEMMATNVIELQPKLEQRAAEDDALSKRWDRNIAIFRMMNPVIAEMHTLGADDQQIAECLMVLVDELTADKADQWLGWPPRWDLGCPYAARAVEQINNNDRNQRPGGSD